MALHAPVVQYTIRGIPDDVDKALRRMAKERDLSLNELLVRELISATGNTQNRKRRSLEGIAGTWVEDPEFDRILESQRGIDEELWR